MKKEIKYKSTGYVFGNYWGGGQSSYSAKKLESNKLADLIKQAKDGLNGSLDSGMGYESLICAMLIITKTTTIKINDKYYHNKKIIVRYVGKITDRIKKHLHQHSLN